MARSNRLHAAPDCEHCAFEGAFTDFLAVGSRVAVVVRLRPGAAGGVFDRQLERERLVRLRGGGELRIGGARADQEQAAETRWERACPGAWLRICRRWEDDSGVP